MNLGPDRLSLTRHATARMRQRGVPTRILDLLLEHADCALLAGDGCETLCLSPGAAASLVAGGTAPDDAARAARLVALIGRNGVTSVIRPAKGAWGRRYRRQMPIRTATRRSL
ncbi:MAG: hypothetical protein JWP59_4777 [Massilia sp.]|nr:hypothetical protein [Massilia sp.]